MTNPSRNSKKHALEKLKTNTNTRKTRDNEEMTLADDLNDLIINTNVSQNRNASKEGRKKMVQETDAMIIIIIILRVKLLKELNKFIEITKKEMLLLHNYR